MRWRPSRSDLFWVLFLAIFALSGYGIARWGQTDKQLDTATVDKIALAETVLKLCADGRPELTQTVSLQECLKAQQVIEQPLPQAAEVQDAEVQEPEFQDPEIQDPEIQDPEQQIPCLLLPLRCAEPDDPDPNDPDTDDPEVDDPEDQDPEIQDPEVDDPEPNDPQDPPGRQQFRMPDGSTWTCILDADANPRDPTYTCTTDAPPPTTTTPPVPLLRR